MVWVAVIVGLVTAPAAWGLDPHLCWRARHTLGGLIAAGICFIAAGIVGPPVVTAWPAYLTAICLAAAVNLTASTTNQRLTERNRHE